MAHKQSITDEQRQTIARCWATHSLPEISRKVSLSVFVVKRVAKELRLGKKPQVGPKVAKPKRSVEAPEDVGGDFLDDLGAIYKRLEREKEDILSELDELSTEDRSPATEQRIAQLKAQLERVEDWLIAGHECLDESAILTHRRDRDGFQTLKSTVRHFENEDVRKKEGRDLSIMHLAHEKARRDWMEPNNFGDGTMDPVFMCPEDYAGTPVEETSGLTDEQEKLLSEIMKDPKVALALYPNTVDGVTEAVSRFEIGVSENG